MEYIDLLTGTRSSAPAQTHDISRNKMVINIGRISVLLCDDLEKALRFTTIKGYGGRQGDLTRAVGAAITTWVTQEE